MKANKVLTVGCTVAAVCFFAAPILARPQQVRPQSPGSQESEFNPILPNSTSRLPTMRVPPPFNATPRSVPRHSLSPGATMTSPVLPRFPQAVTPPPPMPPLGQVLPPLPSPVPRLPDVTPPPPAGEFNFVFPQNPMFPEENFGFEQ